jgi:tetratricopeptide (TPR) repeat protein
MAKQRARSLILFLLVEAGLLLTAAGAVLALAPAYRAELGYVLLGAAALGLLVAEGIHVVAGRLRARGYARRFDLRHELREMAEEPDEIDQALATEEILEEFADSGRRALQEGRHEEAAENFRRAIELDPRQSRLYNYLGMTLRRAGRPAEAVQAYLNAIAIDYDYVKAHYNLALCYEDLGRTDDAVEEWTRYVDIGEVVGEREEMLDRARERVRELREGAA